MANKSSECCLFFGVKDIQTRYAETAEGQGKGKTKQQDASSELGTRQNSLAMQSSGCIQYYLKIIHTWKQKNNKTRLVMVIYAVPCQASYYPR